MARAKTESFDAALVRTASLAKALSHPVRLRILEILGARRGCICGGLVELLPLAQSTVSQHLRELRDAGLIQGDFDGPRTCYCLDPKALAEAWTSFKDVFHRLCGRPEDCEEGQHGKCVTPGSAAPASGARPKKDRKASKRSHHEKKQV